MNIDRNDYRLILGTLAIIASNTSGHEIMKAAWNAVAGFLMVIYWGVVIYNIFKAIRGEQ